MILTCPACSAQYMVSAETIGEQGRAVRCAKCKHEWVQKSEKDSLDELISRIQSVEIDEIGFEEHLTSNVREDVHAGLFARLKEAISGYRSRLKFWLDRKAINFKSRLHLDKKTFGGIAAAAIVFSVLLSVILLTHNKISHNFPQTEPIFEALGLKKAEEVASTPNPEENLAFDRLEISKGEGTTKLSGMLLNLSKQEVPVPIISVVLLDKDSHEIYNRDLDLGQPIIGSEDRIDFQIDLGIDIPDAARKLAIRFTNLPLPEENHGEDG